MTFDVGKALQEGFDRLLARSGLLWLVVFVVFGGINSIVQQSLNSVQFDQVYDSQELAPLFENLPFTAAEFVEVVEQSTPIAYLDFFSLPALLGFAVLLAVIAEAIRIAAVRTFVSEEMNSIPRQILTRRIGWAVLNGIVAGIIVGVLVLIGTIFFILPGVFLAISFLFVRQEIAVADKSVVEAIEGSWQLAAGERFSLLAMVLVLLAIWLGSSLLASLLDLNSSIVASFVGVVIDAVVLAYSVAVVSRAYHQLESQEEAVEDKFEDIDPELLP